MKKKEQRLNDIMALVREQPTISIKELAKILDVSEMTIRRDISYLKESNAMTQMLGMNAVSYTHLADQPRSVVAISLRWS